MLRRSWLAGLAGGFLAVVGGGAACADEPKLAGTWAWSYKGADGVEHRHVLEIVEAGGKLTARERYDDEEPVEVQALKLDGRDLGFSVRRGDRNSVYSGKLADADTINGKVTVTIENRNEEFTWTAQRRKAPPAR